jgi:RNA polymerase sigma factor (sigma-70 family)
MESDQQNQGLAGQGDPSSAKANGNHLNHISEFESSGSSPGRINYCYARRAEDPLGFENELEDYVKAVVRKLVDRKRLAFDQEELVQGARIKLWEKLDSFKGEAKFSSGLFSVINNFLVDEFRKIRRRKEVELLDWKDYETDYSGSRSGADNHDVSDEDESGGGVRLGLSHRAEEALNHRLDLQRLEAALPAEDRQILGGYLNGEKPAETAKRLGVKVKRVNYRMQIIRARALRLSAPHRGSSLPQMASRASRFPW